VHTYGVKPTGVALQPAAPDQGVWRPPPPAPLPAYPGRFLAYTRNSHPAVLNAIPGHIVLAMYAVDQGRSCFKKLLLLIGTGTGLTASFLLFELFAGLLYVDGRDTLQRPVIVLNSSALPERGQRDAALAAVLNALQPLVTQVCHSILSMCNSV
jgi:hypothetical protein